MPRQSKDTVAILGIDIGKNTFHLVGLNKRGAIVLRQNLSRRQLEARLTNLPPCLIGMEACVGAHHLISAIDLASLRFNQSQGKCCVAKRHAAQDRYGSWPCEKYLGSPKSLTNGPRIGQEVVGAIFPVGRTRRRRWRVSWGGFGCSFSPH